MRLWRTTPRSTRPARVASDARGRYVPLVPERHRSHVTRRYGTRRRLGRREHAFTSARVPDLSRPSPLLASQCLADADAVLIPPRPSAPLARPVGQKMSVSPNGNEGCAGATRRGRRGARGATACVLAGAAGGRERAASRARSGDTRGTGGTGRCAGFATGPALLLVRSPCSLGARND